MKMGTEGCQKGRKRHPDNREKDQSAKVKTRKIIKNEDNKEARKNAKMITRKMEEDEHKT